jgi:hypothetical protein
VDNLNNQALVHQLTAQLPSEQMDNSTDDLTDDLTDNLTAGSTTNRYDSHRFYRVVIDTGASKYSTAGYGQFQALQRTNGITLNKNTKGQVKVQFGISSTSSIGSTMVKTPIGQVEFHIMHARTPFLLSLADMDKLGVYFNNLSNVIVTPKGDVLVVRRFGHSFLLWDTSLQSFIAESFMHNPCFLTDVELQRLHHKFGHPLVSRLQKVLEQSGHNIDKDALEYLTKYCMHCQKYGQLPHKFKFSLKDNVDFNVSIIVDVFYLEGKLILHIVDEGTSYQARRFL